MNDDSTKDLPSNDPLKEIVALIQAMSEQLSALQMKVDERLYDTRPLWESVQSQINDLRAETELGSRELRAEMERGFSGVRTDMELALGGVRTDMELALGGVRADMDLGFRELRADLTGGFQELRAESKGDQDKLRTELARELRHLSNSLDTIAGNMVRFDAIQREIESRIRDIEFKAS